LASDKLRWSVWQKISLEHWLSFILTILILFFAGSVDYHYLLPLLGLSEPVELQLSPVGEIPIAKQSLANGSFVAVEPTASISAQAVYAYEVESGTELYAKNADELFHPASVTKLMTALVVKEQLPLESEIEIIKADILQSNKIELVVGERLTVADLIKAMLISSSNEAAEALARNYPGGYYALVSAMNQKAQALHLEKTTFTNVVGYDHTQHLSTAREINILAREAMKDEFLRSVVKEPQLVIQDVAGQYRHFLENTNQLLMEDSRVKGIKTGTTEAAGEVLVAEYQTAGHTIIIAVLGSQDRFNDMTQLFNWLLGEYSWYQADFLLLNLE